MAAFKKKNLIRNKPPMPGNRRVSTTRTLTAAHRADSIFEIITHVYTTEYKTPQNQFNYITLEYNSIFPSII